MTSVRKETGHGVYIEEEILIEQPTTDDFQYSPWFDGSDHDTGEHLITIFNKGDKSLTYKVQTKTVLAEDDEEFDLKDDNAISEWDVAANEKTYQTVIAAWSMVRVGYKSKDAGQQTSITARMSSR